MRWFGWCYETKISKNKAFEIDINHFKQWLTFELSLKWIFNDHHAGPSFHICLFGLWTGVQIFDIRHWDYETNNWEKYDD